MKRKNSALIEKRAFLQASTTLVLGLLNLLTRRLVDYKFREGIQKLQSLPLTAQRALEAHSVDMPSVINTTSLRILTNHLDEGYISLSYSWLEAYLSVVEEMLYLHDPRSLGDNLQIKLGKILEASSIAELVHDTVKKRSREKSGWGLKNRIIDLRDTYGLHIKQDDATIDDISKVRNDLIHEKRVGDLATVAGKVRYKLHTKRENKIDADAYMDTVLNLTVDLFSETSKRLGINVRNKHYKFLKNACIHFRSAFKYQGSDDTEKPSLGKK